MTTNDPVRAVIQAAREVAAAWPKGRAFCEQGSTLYRLHEAIAALPEEPFVCVPVNLIKRAIIVYKCAIFDDEECEHYDCADEWRPELKELEALIEGDA